jgi:predicted acylesterase/phospholipase RssA
MASAAIPLAFKPVDHYVDGGVTRNQPLNAAIMLEEAARSPLPPEPLYVLIPTPQTGYAAGGLSSIVERVLEIWTSAPLEAELELTKLRQRARAELNKRPIPPVCVIRPAVPLERLGGGLLKFGSYVDRIIDQGRSDAQARLASFDAMNSATWF